MHQRILIVDDDAAVSGSLKRVFEETGYTVELATDGQAGVKRLQQQRFDLLLLDLNLPHVSGFDLLDLAAEQYPALPVLILTGELEHCEPGALAGADILMEKPPDVGRLLQTVAALLSETAQARRCRLGDRLARERALPRLGRGRLPLPTPPAGLGRFGSNSLSTK